MAKNPSTAFVVIHRLRRFYGVCVICGCILGATQKIGRSAMNRLMFAPFLLLFCAAPVLSQSSPPGGPPPPEQRMNADRIRQQDMNRREYQLRNYGNEPVTPKDERQVKALMAQTEEDFTRILTLH